VGLFRAQDFARDLTITTLKDDNDACRAAVRSYRDLWERSTRSAFPRRMRSRNGAPRTASQGPVTAPPSPDWCSTQLRRRASSAWLMDSDTPRARTLGMLKLERGLNADAVAALCDGGRFAPEPLTDTERAALTTRSTKNAPAHIAGDYPEWLDPQFTAVFGETRVDEAIAMASRAPLDLRVNTLKASQDKVLASMKHLGARATPWSPWGLRIDLAPTRAIRASTRKRLSSRAALKFRTKALSLRRCLRVRNRASR
jgi:hypothetical protein